MRLMHGGQVDGGGALARGSAGSARAPARGIASAASAARARRRPPAQRRGGRGAAADAPSADGVAGAQPAARARARPSPSASATRSAARSARAECSRGAQALDRACRCRCPPGRRACTCRRPRTSRCASYSYSLAAAPRWTGEPAGWRAISRRSTIRWRGVVVSAAARADRLAEAALDAARRRPPRSRGVRLEVAQVHVGVAVEHDARAEHAVRVGQLLDPPHHLGGLGAPLALDERRHVAPGAVLGLQRAVVLVDDQVDEVVHERLVALAVGRLREVGREQEVQVAGRGVARRRRAGSRACRAAPGCPRAASAIALGRHADVLDDQRRRRAGAAGRRARTCPRARVQATSISCAVAREVGGREQLVPGEDLARPRARARRARRRRRRRTRPAARRDSSGSSCQSSGVPGDRVRRRRSASVATISSTARRARGDERGHGRRRGVDRCREVQPRRSSCAAARARVSNTASATKASVPSEPTSRRRKISSGVSASRNAHSR